METREKSIDVTETSKDEVLNPIETPAAPQAAEESTEAVPAETPVCDDQCPENAEPSAPAPKSKEEVLEALTRLAADEAAEISREEIARLKQLFYAFRKAELEQEMADFVAQGNEEAAFVPAVNESEEKFKELMNTVKDRKAAIAAAQEAEKQQNFERKKALIDELAAISADTDNVNRAFPRVKEIQAEFKLIGEVPATEATDQWKAYQQAVEQFYDQLKVNKDLRDYDFKKNLDSKTLLLEEAEALGAEEDVITAYRRLQELHNKWRRIGPVAKELRDEIWEKFKAASAVVNKRYQAYFEERKAREAEAEAAKAALCEQVEAIDTEALGGFGAWDKATAEIQELQGKWRELGYASRKANRDLFARFRAACDKFFAAKADYFRNTREQLAANLAAKTALADEAEALKDSTEWTKAGARFVAMQQEWRAIGPVAKRHSDAVWRRFMDACNHFFDQKKKAGSGRRNEENANLAAKRALVDRLNALSAETPRAELLAAIKEIQDEWQTIGHVPFREKDKVYEQYRARLDELRDGISDGRRRERREQFAGAVARMEGYSADRERDRLARVLEAKRSELRTLENNLGFLNAKSKSGNSLLHDFERKIERLRDDIAEIADKLKMLAK